MSSMTAAAPAAPKVACVNVPGVLGPSCDAVYMNGPLYGVADAPDGAVGQADWWLAGLVRRLGRQPCGEDLGAALRRLSGRRWLPWARRPEVTGAAVAVLEPGWLTVGQLGSAFVYRVRDHRPCWSRVRDAWLPWPWCGCDRGLGIALCWPATGSGSCSTTRH